MAPGGLPEAIPRAEPNMVTFFFFAPFFRLLAGSWGALGRLLARLGALLARLGPLLDRLGPLLRRSKAGLGAVLGALGAVLAALGGLLGALGGTLGHQNRFSSGLGCQNRIFKKH